MASAAHGRIVAWEWCDDVGQWNPYPSPVSNYIEHQHKSCTDQATLSKISLGNAEATFQVYDVDLKQMIQTRTDTGLNCLFVFF